MNYYNYPKQSPVEEFKNFFREGSMLARLIMINTAIWILIQVARVLFFLMNIPDEELINTIVHYFAVPASLPSVVTQPWTLLTYMFLHVDIWHILFNMLWLFWFGKIFTQYLSAGKLLTVYLLGGFTGGLVYIASFNIFPVFAGTLEVSRALGASASVMAIVTAISFYVPNFTINLLLIGRIRILYLALILFVFDFFMIPSGNSGGHIAHIGGAIFGAFYAWFLPRAGSFQKKENFFRDFFDNFKAKKKPAGNYHPGYSRPVTDDEYNRQKYENQKRTDAILEKISKGGYDSLSREEKDFLFNSSKKK